MKFDVNAKNQNGTIFGLLYVFVKLCVLLAGCEDFIVSRVYSDPVSPEKFTARHYSNLINASLM